MSFIAETGVIYDNYNYLGHKGILIFDKSFSCALTVMRPVPQTKAAAFWIVREQAVFNFRSRSFKSIRTLEPSLLPFLRSHFSSKLLFTLLI